jgi:hypothetical protein
MISSGGGSGARRGSEIGGHDGEDAHDRAMAPTAATNASEHLPSISGPMLHPVESPGQRSGEGVLSPEVSTCDLDADVRARMDAAKGL